MTSFNDWKKKPLAKMNRAELLEMEQWGLDELREWTSFVGRIKNELRKRKKL